MKGNKERRLMFSPVKTSKIPDEVYEQIVSMINDGQLRPGQRLPSERELASDLGVSRQSIREAIYRADSMGLIEVRQGEGSFVLSSIRENLRSPMTILLEGQADKIFEFLEIRKLIEAWCAEKASTKATTEDLNRMGMILEKMEKVVPTDTAWEKVDMDFHLSVAAATQNIIAMHIMEALKDSFHNFFRVRRITTRADRKERLLQQHIEIFKAISKRDPVLAKRKALDHLDFIDKLIKEDMKKGKNE